MQIPSSGGFKRRLGGTPHPEMGFTFLRRDLLLLHLDYMGVTRSVVDLLDQLLDGVLMALGFPFYLYDTLVLDPLGEAYK